MSETPSPDKADMKPSLSSDEEMEEGEILQTVSETDIPDSSTARLNEERNLQEWTKCLTAASFLKANKQRAVLLPQNMPEPGCRFAHYHFQRSSAQDEETNIGITSAPETPALGVKSGHKKLRSPTSTGSTKMVSPSLGYEKVPEPAIICFRCNLGVAESNKVDIGVIFHKQCFKCCICGLPLTIHSYQRNDGNTEDKEIYCCTHAGKEIYQIKSAEMDALKKELEQVATLRAETESKLREAESSLRSIQAKSKQDSRKMQKRLKEMNKKTSQLESENQTLKNKVQSLQVDLDNSEAVQRNLLKLVQSLQMQLAKMRQAENEVRWQHEDDIDDCNNCKQPFTVKKRKHHCRHCGRIFCADCTTKRVSSGPNFRAAKVCDVCYTILVKDATPYSSTEPPARPD